MLFSPSSLTAAPTSHASAAPPHGRQQLEHRLRALSLSLSLSLCSSHIDPRSRLVIRLENIEENAQSYVNTGQIHAFCDVRHIVEIAFAWAIVDIYFCVRRAFVLYIEDIYFCTILCFGNPVFLYVIFNLDR
ncbi:unnamed protein product [Camellia sinensis]